MLVSQLPEITHDQKGQSLTGPNPRRYTVDPRWKRFSPQRASSHSARSRKEVSWPLAGISETQNFFTRERSSPAIRVRKKT